MGSYGSGAFGAGAFGGSGATTASTRSFLWKSPDGNQLRLSDRPNGIYVLKGVTGLGAAQYTLDRQAKPATDGDLLRGVRASARQIFLPLRVEQPDRPSFLNVKQGINQAFDPELGAGMLYITDGGTTYQISCTYGGGLEGDEGSDAAGQDAEGEWCTTGITLDAVDPFFEYTVPTTFSYGYSGTTPFFPLLPVTLNPAQVLSDATSTPITPTIITNPGRKFAYGVITCTGPGTSIDLYNRDTQQHVTLNYPIQSGQTVTFDMRNQLVTLNDGTNLYPYLAKDDFWPFKAGVNMLTFAMYGANTGSSITGYFYPRTLSIV